MLEIYADLKGRKSGSNFSELEIASHAAGFITDGLETTAVGLSYVLYELSVNPEVQEKLYEEIKTMIDSHGEEIPYDVVQEMKYLDRVCFGIHKYKIYLSSNSIFVFFRKSKVTSTAFIFEQVVH